MGRGEKSLLCDPGSELRLVGREKKKGKYNKWNVGKKKNLRQESIAWHVMFL